MTARILVTLAVALLVGPALVGQDVPAPDRLEWQSLVTDAFKRAKEERKPVLWVIMKDEEIACRRMMEKVYRDPRVVARAAAFILLPCSTYLHERITIEQDGQKRDSCPQFVGVSCADHQTIEREMRARFDPGEYVVAPQHIFCDPDGKVILRKEYELDSKGLLDLMDQALRAMSGEGGKPGDPPPGSDIPPPDRVPGEAAGDPDLSPEVRRLLSLVETASEEERVEAATQLLSTSGSVQIRALVDLLLSKDLGSEKIRARIIRAAGAPAFSQAAPEFARLLELKPTHLRNCVVVTLEEMANPAVAEALLGLWKKERDPEIRKDILRALGPAGTGHAEARALLLQELKGGQEQYRVAAAMALGLHLSGDEEVRAALKKRYPRETGSSDAKVAILYAWYQSKDNSLAGDLDELVSEERNAELKSLAALVRASLGGAPPDLAGQGGGGRGGRAGGGRGGPQAALFRALGRLFSKDKIERNLVRQIRERFPGRGR